MKRCNLKAIHLLINQVNTCQFKGWQQLKKKALPPTPSKHYLPKTSLGFHTVRSFLFRLRTPLNMVFTSIYFADSLSLCKKCSHLEFFWSVFSHVRTGYWEILLISPYSVQMRENTDQKISKYGHFLRSVCFVTRTAFNKNSRELKAGMWLFEASWWKVINALWLYEILWNKLVFINRS